MNLWHELISLLPFEWVHYGFMRSALLAVILVMPMFGLLGTLVVNQRMAFFSDALGHAALAGVAIGVLFGVENPLWVLVVFSVLLGVLMLLLERYTRASMDTVISIVMSFAVASGIVILSRGGGFNRYTGYLIGDLLSIGGKELLGLGILFLCVIGLVGTFFNELIFISINRSLARSRGRKVFILELMFGVLVAAVVAMNIKWVGLLIINAMLVLPAAAARNMARNGKEYVWLAVIFGLFSGLAGLIGSYYFSVATGALIVLIAVGIYALTVMWGWFRKGA